MLRRQADAGEVHFACQARLWGERIGYQIRPSKLDAPLLKALISRFDSL